MSKKKHGPKKKKKKKRIDGYQRTGKKLQPPLAAYPNIQMIDYNRQLLPQFMWLESLLDRYGEEKLPGVVYPFLDLVDDLGTTGEEPVSGLVESFVYVPEAERQTFVDSNKEIIRIAVIEPFGDALRLYRDCPMNWLLASYGDDEESINLDLALASLKRWTAALLDRRGEHSNMARAIVFFRYLKAGKLHIPDGEMIEGLRTYPKGPDRRKTESCIRATSNAFFGQVVQDYAWGDAFWATNGKISICTTEQDKDESADMRPPDSMLSDIMLCYAKGVERFLGAIQEDHQKCLPDPSAFAETSVLSGLLARACALGTDMFTESSLWVAEIGGIILRCLCETLILLAWLVEKDDKELYEQFVQYSLGQQDLYALKLEGYGGYREAFKSLYVGDDKLADTITRDTWEAQLRTVNLGNWAGVDTRKMAEEGGTKTYYDLVFSLCSADVHSQFISLAQWNMMFCTNPLHNSHLIPLFEKRVVNPFLPLTAGVLLQKVCERFFGYYKVDGQSTKVLTEILKEVSDKILGGPVAPDQGS